MHIRPYRFQAASMEKCSHSLRLFCMSHSSHFARTRFQRLSLSSSHLRRDPSRRRRSLSCSCLGNSLKEDIRVLRNELSNAVSEEDYLRAATLRDEILDLEDKDPVLSIKKQLAHAIEIEDYKIAAELRDELRRVDAEELESRVFAVNMDPIACNSDVLTRGIRVRVRSFYVEHLSAAAQGKYVFAYQVEITNEGDETVQLKNRSWTIVDGRGNTEQANGPGVIGQQPILGPGRYFQYMSICPLETPVGTMEGFYEMVVMNRHSQETFFASIGKFGLDVNKHRQFKD